uniref:Uncharacterized protein n=1 Tax=Physcomitrium patens TaxID=3218 RepID=A0A2K1JMF7_PHYPA|nr:hypothetical protein PHYPA_017543 [Physcomitrium patens]
MSTRKVSLTDVMHVIMLLSKANDVRLGHDVCAHLHTRYSAFPLRTDREINTRECGGYSTNFTFLQNAFVHGKISTF